MNLEWGLLLRKELSFLNFWLLDGRGSLCFVVIWLGKNWGWSFWCLVESFVNMKWDRFGFLLCSNYFDVVFDLNYIINIVVVELCGVFMVVW